MNIEHRLQSFFTYVCGFGSMIGAVVIQQMPFWTICLQFGMALIGFIMVVIRFFYDRKLRKQHKIIPLNADID